MNDDDDDEVTGWSSLEISRAAGREHDTAESVRADRCSVSSNSFRVRSFVNATTSSTHTLTTSNTPTHTRTKSQQVSKHHVRHRRSPSQSILRTWFQCLQTLGSFGVPPRKRTPHASTSSAASSSSSSLPSHGEQQQQQRRRRQQQARIKPASHAERLALALRQCGVVEVCDLDLITQVGR